MRGFEIIASGKPRGFMDSGFLSGTTLFPGMCLEIKPAVVDQQGKFTWRARSLAKGAKGEVAVLLNDFDQGQTIFGFDGGLDPAGGTDQFGQAKRIWKAYQDGYFAPLIYWPHAGEELNMLLNSGPGTGSAGTYNVGDLLAVDDEGMLIANNAFTSAPFKLLEYITTAFSGTYLALVKYLGNNA